MIAATRGLSDYSPAIIYPSSPSFHSRPLSPPLRDKRDTSDIDEPKRTCIFSSVQRVDSGAALRFLEVNTAKHTHNRSAFWCGCVRTSKREDTFLGGSTFLFAPDRIITPTRRRKLPYLQIKQIIITDRKQAVRAN